jgi:hypothetical protein
MKKEDAIKYLQQLYPNGGYCWLDEQRIEAIGMAINALQEEPVSEDLEEASKEWLAPQLDNSYAGYGEAKMMELTRFDGYAMIDAIEFGANWQKEQFEKNRLAHCDTQTEEEAEIESDFVMGIIENEHRQPTFDDAIKYGMRLQKKQMMAKAVDGVVAFDYYGDDDKTYGLIAHNSFCLEDFGLKDMDKVKMILIKEIEL